ncbi:J domain-containing protein [Lyngbya confervoides]|uniref:J domain-containing protein n=1 Tax=Lyngbya confervoides BDU141951 TaxID=1574623 RepID=A0ABD4T135_9CYAN|nr:J domain-containing protein [Lyngbya confervoides]MCM1982193.1 J domain-containing protein [Lyngbya confervoides BDU141951]
MSSNPEKQAEPVGNGLNPENSYYDILGVSTQATQEQIRSAYRRKSKQYHPDTTPLDPREAAVKFQVLNQAYDHLRDQKKRMLYDLNLQAAASPNPPPSRSQDPPPRTGSNSAFLEARDRPLSPGEIFALFILGLTFVGCLLLAIVVGISRGEVLIQALPQEAAKKPQVTAQQITVPLPDSQPRSPTQAQSQFSTRPAPHLLHPLNLQRSSASG